MAAGVSTFVRYPGDAVELPGFGSDALLYTTNVSGVAGLFNAGDSDSDFDGRDDTAAASLISIEEPILPGPFASFRFVCVPLGPLPRAQDFSCVSDVATLGGVTVPSSCTVELATEP